MSSREKRRQKIEQNPKQVRFEELDALLRAYGFVMRQPRRGSSHYSYNRGLHYLCVAKNRPHLKEYAVQRALKVLRKIEAEEEGR